MSEAKKLAKEAAGFIPGVGTAMDIASAGQAIASGNIPLAALETASAAVGLVPGIGRVLGKALKFTAKKTGLVKFTKEDILTKGDDNYKAIRGNVDESLDKRTAQEVFKSDDSKIEAIRKAQSKSRTMDVAGARPFKKEALQLEKDEITPKEFRKKAFADVEKFDNVEELPTYTEVVFSLDKNKRAKGIIGLDKTIPKNVKPLEAGDEVKARLDIPAYNRYDVYVPQITYKKPNAKGAESVFSRTMVIKDVTFGTSSKAAFDISRGVQQKFPHATINGTVATNPLTKKAFKDNEAHGIAKAVIDDDDFIHVGYNPDRGGFFYDRGTKMPIFKSPFVVQIGKQIFAKRPVETVAERTAKLRQLDLRSIRDRSGSSLKKGRPTLFNQGGLTTDEQTQQAFNQGGYGVAGKFTSDTGVSAAKEKGNFEGFGYKGEAKEAPAETKPYGGFQESVDMSSGGDDKDNKPMSFAKTAENKSISIKPLKKPMQFAPKTDPKMPIDFAETKEMAEARVNFNNVRNALNFDIAKKKSDKEFKNAYDNLFPDVVKSVIDKNYFIREVVSDNEDLGTYKTVWSSNLNEKDNAIVVAQFIAEAIGGNVADIDPTSDDWAWCSAFVDHILSSVGADRVSIAGESYAPIRATNYLNYGKNVRGGVNNGKTGDILVLQTDADSPMDHTGFLIGPELYDLFNLKPIAGISYMLGGNQGNAVNIKPINNVTIESVRRISGITEKDKNQLKKDNPLYNSFTEALDATPKNYQVVANDTLGKIAKQFNTTVEKLQELNPEIVNPNEIFIGQNIRLFNKGGMTMEQQMSLFDEGGMKDDGLDRDPVSGNEIPPGSLAKEVRDDIPAQLSEGEYVVPADVVQYYGVKFFEDLRMEAKRGLAEMEATGRIGGEPMSVTMIAIGEAEEEEKKQKERQKKAFGGIIEANQGVLAKNMANIESYRSFNPYTASIVGGTQFSPIAQTGQSMGLTTPDTHSKMFYHPDGRVQAVPGRMVTVNGEQKFLPNPNYKQFTTGEWSDTPPAQAKAQTTETPKEDRDDSGKSSFDFEAQRLQNENSLKVSAERLGLDPKVFAGLGFFTRFKLFGEEIKAMKGQKIDKDKINSIVSEDGKGSPFDLKSMLKTVTTLGFLSTGNVMIPLAARIIGGFLIGDDDEVKKKDVKSTTTTTSTSKITPDPKPFSKASYEKSTPMSQQASYEEAAGITSKPKTTAAKSVTPGASTKYVGRTDSSGKKLGDVGYKSALRERQEAKQDKAEGGLINKPKRNPKKPRGKGLGSK